MQYVGGCVNYGGTSINTRDYFRRHFYGRCLWSGQKEKREKESWGSGKEIKQTDKHGHTYKVICNT